MISNTAKKLRSPICWFGGKGNMTSKLLKLIPKHKIYVEPFGGGASLLFAKEPSLVEVYNDLDSGLVNFFRVLRDPNKFEKFYRLVYLTPYSREEYYFCRDTWEQCEDEIERAYRWYVVARMSFSGDFGHSWGFAVTENCRGMAKTTSGWLSIIDMLPQIHERLMRVQIEHKDFRDIIKTYDTPDTLFYCIPASEKIIGTSCALIPIGNVTDYIRLANGNSVNAVFKRNANEEIVEFTIMGLGKFFPVRCSKEHKIFVYESGRFFYKEAQDLCVGDMVVINTDSQVHENIPVYKNNKVKQGIRKFSYLNKDNLRNLCRFIGFYLAEGHKQDGLVFSFGLNEVAYCEEVKRLALELFGIEAKIYRQCPHPTSNQVFVLGRDLEDWFNHVVLGNTAKEKALADWVMQLHPELQFEVLRYWLKGDGGLWIEDKVDEIVVFRRTGHRNKFKITGTTASEKLAWQMYHIALRCKLHPCIKQRGNAFDVYFTTKRDVERLLGIKINGRSCQRRRWTDYGLLTPVTSIRFVPFEGVLVDISTKYGNFIHQSGCVMHNCDPPYIQSTRKSGKYKHEMSNQDHIDLVNLLLSIKGKCMLSGYQHEIYTPLEENGWKRIDFKTVCYAVAKTRQTGILGEGSAKAKQSRIESVWINYDIKVIDNGK